MSGGIIPDTWHESQGADVGVGDDEFREGKYKRHCNKDTKTTGCMGLEFRLEISGLEIQNWESSSEMIVEAIRTTERSQGPQVQ